MSDKEVSFRSNVWGQQAYRHALMQVRDSIAKARAASKIWRNSTFGQRRKLLKILLKFVVENQETICR